MDNTKKFTKHERQCGQSPTIIVKIDCDTDIITSIGLFGSFGIKGGEGFKMCIREMEGQKIGTTYISQNKYDGIMYGMIRDVIQDYLRFKETDEYKSMDRQIQEIKEDMAGGCDPEETQRAINELTQ